MLEGVLYAFACDKKGRHKMYEQRCASLKQMDADTYVRLVPLQALAG